MYNKVTNKNDVDLSNSDLLFVTDKSFVRRTNDIKEKSSRTVMINTFPDRKCTYEL